MVEQQVYRLLKLLLTSNNVMTFTLTSVTLSTIILISYKIGKINGMRYMDYANRITLKNDQISKNEFWLKILNVFSRRTNLSVRSLIGFTGGIYFFDFMKELIFELIFKEKILVIENEEILTFEQAKVISLELYSTHFKTFKNVEYALYCLTISAMMNYGVYYVLYLTISKLKHNLEILKKKRNFAVKSLLNDLGNEVSSSLNHYYHSQNLKKIKILEKEEKNLKKEKEAIERRNIVERKENIAFKKFLKKFENDFTWCGNCITYSCINETIIPTMPSKMGLSEVKSTEENQDPKEEDDKESQSDFEVEDNLSKKVLSGIMRAQTKETYFNLKKNCDSEKKIENEKKQNFNFLMPPSQIFPSLKKTNEKIKEFLSVSHLSFRTHYTKRKEEKKKRLKIHLKCRRNCQKKYFDFVEKILKELKTEISGK